MNIFITGGTGFLGAHLVDALLGLGHRVRIGQRNVATQSNANSTEYIQADILDKDSLRDAMSGIDAVFHVAGFVSYDPSKNQQMHNVNVLGTRNVGEIALELGVKRLVYTSSISALGINTNPNIQMNETHTFNAESSGMAYFTTKYGAEQELHRLKSKGLDYVIVNPGSILGPKDSRKKKQVYPGLIQRLNPPFAIPGGNSFVDIEDAVAGHLLAWKNGRCGERYILGGENLTLRELIDRTNRILGRRETRFCLPPWLMPLLAQGVRLARWMGKPITVTPELIRNMASWYLFVDSSKATQELGYTPHSIDGAITRTLEWLREE